MTKETHTKQNARPTERRKSFGRGFSLVESLVAIVILITAITGVSSAVRTAISSYTFSRDQITAFYLAQEGFEFIRNMRDENALNNRNWLTGIASNINDPCWFGNACIVDPINSTVPTRCSAIESCPLLRQDATNLFYGHNGAWSETKFRREIIITQVDAKEISVLVTINWMHGSTNQEFQARENILNWP
ncbi:MAG: prepilin-type N-terminal cleavage/methylation domain-containing protein [Minisyncoccia bacterium]